MEYKFNLVEQEILTTDDQGLEVLLMVLVGWI